MAIGLYQLAFPNEYTDIVRCRNFISFVAYLRINKKTFILTRPFSRNRGVNAVFICIRQGEGPPEECNTQNHLILRDAFF
ncbi:hypothetical protein NQ318_009078 [Aromia moschata]|uniref:Uncharacterized protein n=1 Tax=Aromia moschata TaxID=1265417 RepID=A0AAV8YWX8_9CUCU|nr:hypothetical protein NQ318_009078 [Aromia moschata]